MHHIRLKLHFLRPFLIVTDNDFRNCQFLLQQRSVPVANRDSILFSEAEKLLCVITAAHVKRF